MIVTKKENQALDGNLLELLLRRGTTPVDTLALFTSLYHSYHEGHVAAPVQGEGYLIAYTPGYQYVGGKHFRDGQLLAGNARLRFFPTGTPAHVKTGSPTLSQATGVTANSTVPTGPVANYGSACTNWYNQSDGSYIETTGDCSLSVDYGTPAPTMPDAGGIPSGPNDYGGGGGGYGGGGGSSAPTDLITADIGIASVGDTKVTMSKPWDAATKINVVIEFTKATHVVDKITVISTGLTAATKFGQVGNGIASYDAFSNTYNYVVTFQQVISTVATGDILGGPLFEASGTYYPATNQGTMNFKQLP